MGRYAIKTPPQHADWSDILEMWRVADETDVFESAWVFDHFYPLQGDTSGPCLESWVTLSALAQATSRLRIGCMVNGMHFRHPAVTASMAATLDIVSGGRLNLGLGAGWYEPETEAYGIPLGTLGERMDRFEEGVEVIVSLLTRERTTFHGTHYRLEDAMCEPKAVQRPRPPIAIGGKGEKRTLRLVARHAQWWDALRIEPDEWRRLYEVLLGHCEDVGRDPDEITTSTHVMWSKDREPEAVVDAAEKAFETGVDVAIFSARPPYDVSMVESLAAVLTKRG